MRWKRLVCGVAVALLITAGLPLTAHAVTQQNPRATYTSPAEGFASPTTTVTINVTFYANGNTDLVNKTYSVVPFDENKAVNPNESGENMFDQAQTLTFPTDTSTVTKSFTLPLLFAGANNHFGFFLTDNQSMFLAFGINNDTPDELTINYTGESLPAYRFWSPPFNNPHFYTLNAQEKEHLIDFDNYDPSRAPTGNWTYEGIAYRAIPAGTGGTCTGHDAVYRFYSTRFQSHFFTASDTEKRQVQSDPNWTSEGVAYCADIVAPASGTVPLHRFWSPRFKKHFFTADAGENSTLLSDANWTSEGVAYNVVPVQ